MHKFPLCGEMAPDDERDLIEAVVTCEGNLHDPDFSERFQTLVNNLKTVLYTKEEPFKIRKVEPWNSVRVTISIPKEAAQRLRVLAQQGSQVLRQLGILSVQVEGDQVISLTLAGRYNSEPQEVILRANDAPIPSTPLAAAAASSSSSLPCAATVPLPVAAISAAPVAGPSGVTLDILSSSSSSAFRSPNVVAPSGEAIPLPPKNASGAPRPPLGGPFPFASMTHAAQAMQRNESSNPLIANSTNTSPSPSISPAPSGVLSTPLTPNPAVNAVPPVNNNNSIAPVNSSVGASQQTTVTIPVLVQTQTANHTAPVSVGLSVQGVPLTNINLTNVTVKSDQVTRYILNSSSNVNTNAISQASPSQSLQLQLVNVNVPPPYPGVNSNSSSGSNVNSNNNNTNSSNHLVHHHHLKQQGALSSPRLPVTSSSNSSATVTMVGAQAAGVSVGQSSSQSSSAGKSNNNGNFITPSEPVRLSGTGSLKSRTVGQVQGEAKSKPSQPPPHAVLKSLLAQGKEPSTHLHSSQAPPQLTSSGKPRQFLINPLTGHLEPMPSESSSESEASEDDDETEVVPPSRGKGSRLLLTAQMKAINMHSLPPNLQMSDTAKAIASIESAQSSLMQKINASLNPGRIVRPGSPASSSGRKSRDESLNPSLSAKDINKEKDTPPLVVNSVPGEKIKLRLKLEKSEPVMSSAYKVEFMKKSEKSSLSSGGFSSSQSSAGGGTSPAPGEQPRVPPLHISLRGKNAAVVVSPRREDKDKDFSKSMLEQSLGSIPSSVSSEKLMNSFKLQNSKRIKSRLKSSDSTNSNDSDKFSGSSKKATKISRPRLSKDNSSGSSWSESTSVHSGNLDGIVEDPLKSRLYNSEEKTPVSISQNQASVDCNHASAVVDKVSNVPSKVQPGGLVDLISGNSSMTNTMGKVKKSRRKSELMSSRTAENFSNSNTLPLNVTSQSAEIAHAQGTQLMKHLSQSQPAIVNDLPVHETYVGTSRTPPTPISCDIDSKETTKVPEKVSVSTSTPGGLVPSATPTTLIAKDSLQNAPKATPKPPDIPKLHKGPVPKELEIMSAQVNTVIPEAKVSKSPKPMPELLALPLSSPDKSTDHSHFSISSNPHHPLTQFHHTAPQSKEAKSSHPPGTVGSGVGSGGGSPTPNSAILSRSLMSEMVNAALRTSQSSSSSSSVTPSLLSQQSQSQQSSQSQLLNKLLSDRQKHKEKDGMPSSPFAGSGSTLPVLREKERDQSSKSTPGVSMSSVSSGPPSTSSIPASASSNLSNRVKGSTPTILRSRVQSSSSPRISTGTSTDKEQTSVPMPTLTPSPALKSLLEKRKQQIPSSPSILPLAPVQMSPQSQKSSQDRTEEMEAEVAKVQKRLNQIGGVEIQVRKVRAEDVTLPNKALRDKVEVEVQLCVSSSPSSSPATCEPKGESPSANNSSAPLLAPSLEGCRPTSALRSELVTMGAPVLDGSGSSASSGNTNVHANALSLPLAVALPPIITKAEDPSGAPGEDSGIDSMDALSEKSPNQGESPARKESDQFCDSSSVTTTKSSHFVDTNTNINVSSNCVSVSSIDAVDPHPPNLLLQPAERELESDLEKELVGDEEKNGESDAPVTMTSSSSVHPSSRMESTEEKDVDMEEASVNVNDREGGVSDGIVQRVDSPVRNQVPCESIDITMNKNQSMQMEEMPTNLTPTNTAPILSKEIDVPSSEETTNLPEPSQTPSLPTTLAIAPDMPQPNPVVVEESPNTNSKPLETTAEIRREAVQQIPESTPVPVSKNPVPTINDGESPQTTIQEPTQMETVESIEITAPQLTIIPEVDTKQKIVPELLKISQPESREIISHSETNIKAPERKIDTPKLTEVVSTPELINNTIPVSDKILAPEQPAKIVISDVSRMEITKQVTTPATTEIEIPTTVTALESPNIISAPDLINTTPQSKTITMPHVTQISAQKSTETTMPQSTTIPIPDTITITKPESMHITSASESSQSSITPTENITMPVSATILMPTPAKASISTQAKSVMPTPTKISIPQSAKISISEPAKVSMPEQSKIAVAESTKSTVPEVTKVAMPEEKTIEMPKSTQIISAAELKNVALPQLKQKTVPEPTKVIPETTKVAILEPIKIAAPEATKIAIPEPTKISMQESTKIAVVEPTKISIQEPTKVAVTEPIKIAAPVPTKIAAPVPTKIAASEPTKIAVTESTKIAVTEPIKIELTEPTKIAEPEPAKIALRETKPVEAPKSTESEMTAVPAAIPIVNTAELTQISFASESGKSTIPELKPVTAILESKPPESIPAISAPKLTNVTKTETAKSAVPEAPKMKTPEAVKLPTPEARQKVIPETKIIPVQEPTKIEVHELSGQKSKPVVPETPRITTVQESKEILISKSTEVKAPEQAKINKQSSQITSSAGLPKLAEPTVVSQVPTVPVKSNAEKPESKNIPDHSNAVEGTRTAATVALKTIDGETSASKMKSIVEKNNIMKNVNAPAVVKADNAPLPLIPAVIESVTPKKEIVVDIQIASAPKVLTESSTVTKKQPVSKVKEATTSNAIPIAPAKTPVKEKQTETEIKKVKDTIIKPQHETIKSLKVEIVSERSRFTKSPIKIQTVKCDVEKVTTPTQTEIKGVPRHYNIITSRPYVSALEQQKLDQKETLPPPVTLAKPKGTVVIEAAKSQKIETPTPTKDNSSASFSTPQLVTVNSSEKIEAVVADMESDSAVTSPPATVPGVTVTSQNSGIEIQPISGQKDERGVEKAGVVSSSADKPVKLGIEAITAALKGRAAASMMQPKVNTVVQTAPVLKANVPVSGPKQVQINLPKEPVVKVEKEIQTAKYVPMRKQMEMLEAQKAALATHAAAQRAGLSTANDVKKAGGDVGIKIQPSPTKEDPVRDVGERKKSPEVPKLHKADSVQINLPPESANSANRVFHDKPPKLSKATETDRAVVVPEPKKPEEKEKERPKTELKTQMNLIAPGGKIQFQSLNANQSINLARTLPSMIQLSKATTATLATGISKIPIVSATSQCATTKVTPMVTLGSISVPIQGGSTTTAAGTAHQTVFAIHPNVSLPANISQHLQQHHSRSVTLIPPNPNMLPIKLVTLPKQTQTQLQSIPNLNRSSPLLEAVNIVTTTTGRAGSPNPKGSPVQNSPLNLGSVSGSNIHLVPISVASAAGGTASPVKVLVSPVKMMPQMLLKSVSQMMANPQTTIRMVRPDLRPQIQVQQEVKKVETAPPPQKCEPAKTTEKDNISEGKKGPASTKSSSSDSRYEDVDGVEILDTGSPGANEEDLPFEADIIHDEKDLADVLAGEIIDTDVMENGMSCLDGPYDFGKDGEDSPGRKESVDSPDFQRFSASSKGFKSSWHSTAANKEESTGHLNSMPDSPIPVMRSSSPLYTYSNSNRSARNSRSRSPSPPEPDVHGEDQEIIDCLSRSPSQPKLSPQNKSPPILERENNEYGSPVKPELIADHTFILANSKTSGTTGDGKGKLDQELSIEIPPVDSPASAHQATDERKSTRSTRSNTRLVSPDITAFRSDTPKPQKFTSKPDASLLKNSPKPSPTGSLKMLSPTVAGTPSSSTRSSPVSNQLLISTPATTAAANSNARAKMPVTNKRKRQESDSSSASKDENMEEKSEIDLNSRPGKRRCSENAAELIKACIGVEDTPKRNSSLIKKMEESKGKDLKGKMAMMTVVEETEDQLDLLLGDPTLRSRGGRSSRGSSEDRSSSRGSSVHRNTVPSRAVSKDEEQRDVKTNSRVNNRVKDNATKSKSSSGNESPHVNSTAQNKKSAGRRSNRSALAKEKSPLTPAKTRTNVRKDPVVISSGSTEKSSTPSTSPENENPRRKTRSSVAGMPDSDMQSFKRRRISKDTKS